MDFRYGGFGSHNHPYRTPSAPSSSNYTSFSEGRIWSGRTLVGEQERFRELEKMRMREEILADERRRDYMLELELRGMHRFQPRMVHDQPYLPADRRVARLEDYGRQSGELEAVGLEVVPFQRKEMITSVPKTGSKGFIGMGNPVSPTVTGSKRKPQSPAVRGNSTDQGSKKKMTEFSCALCEVSATSEHGLQDHLAGKKHLAKEAELKAEHTAKTDKSEIKNSPVSGQIDECEDKKPEGESSGQKFKFWCRMCKSGTSDKKEWNMHKKGVRHLKNQLNRAQKSRGKAGGGCKRI